MEASTTIRGMMAGNTIFVPDYQRAYSWETKNDESQKTTHTDVFLSDLEFYSYGNTIAPYYFGHFLFERKDTVSIIDGVQKTATTYFVIDGQQRLSTIVIFLSALFKQLKRLRNLSDHEADCFEDIIKRRSDYRFSTVEYDRQLFRDYVIDLRREDISSINTVSAKRIVDAFDFFENKLKGKDSSYLERLVEIISAASCTTHNVTRELDVI